MLENKIYLQKYLEKLSEQLFSYVQPQKRERDYNIIELRLQDKVRR